MNIPNEKQSLTIGALILRSLKEFGSHFDVIFGTNLPILLDDIYLCVMCQCDVCVFLKQRR